MIYSKFRNNIFFSSIKEILIVFFLIYLLNFNFIFIFIPIPVKCLNININFQKFSLEYELQYSHRKDYLCYEFLENFILNINIEFENSTNQQNGTINYYIDKNITYSELVDIFTLYISGAPKDYLINHSKNETFTTYFFDRIESQEKTILDNSTYINFWIGNSIRKIGDEENFFFYENPVLVQVVDIIKLGKKDNQSKIWNNFTQNDKIYFDTFYFYFETSSTSLSLEINSYYENETKILIFSDIIYTKYQPAGEEIQTFKLNLINWTTNLFPTNNNNNSNGDDPHPNNNDPDNNHTNDNNFLFHFSMIMIISLIIGICTLILSFILIKKRRSSKISEYDKIQL